MTLRLSSPAPIVETLELLQAQHRHLKPWQGRVMVHQLLDSFSVAVRDPGSGDLMASAGFFDLAPEIPGEELSEMWFVCRPELGRHLVSFVRLARLTCRVAADHGTVRLRAFVRAGHAPGGRLARLLGMERVATGGGFERWELQLGRDGPEADGRQFGPARTRDLGTGVGG